MIARPTRAPRPDRQGGGVFGPLLGWGGGRSAVPRRGGCGRDVLSDSVRKEPAGLSRLSRRARVSAPPARHRQRHSGFPLPPHDPARPGAVDRHAGRARGLLGGGVCVAAGPHVRGDHADCARRAAVQPDWENEWLGVCGGRQSCLWTRFAARPRRVKSSLRQEWLPPQDGTVISRQVLSWWGRHSACLPNPRARDRVSGQTTTTANPRRTPQYPYDTSSPWPAAALARSEPPPPAPSVRHPDCSCTTAADPRRTPQYPYDTSSPWPAAASARSE